MHSLVYFLCDGIALDLLEKIDSPDIWEKMKAWPPLLFSFLRQLENQPLQIYRASVMQMKQETVRSLIASNTYGTNPGFVWPRLCKIGEIAFRSQVLCPP